MDAGPEEGQRWEGEQEQEDHVTSYRGGERCHECVNSILGYPDPHLRQYVSVGCNVFSMPERVSGDIHSLCASLQNFPDPRWRT